MDSDSDQSLHDIEYTENEPFFAFHYRDSLLTSPLLKAVMLGDVEAVKAYLKLRKNLNVPDNWGNTPMHIAAPCTNVEVLDLLLSDPEINLNCQNHLGETPLLIGTRTNKSDEIVLRFLEAGCDANITSHMQEHPLHFAVKRSSVVVAKYLIEKGVDVNVTDVNKWTPLHHAVEADNAEAVSLLLYYSANVELSCSYQLTPFMYALNGSKDGISNILFNFYSHFEYVSTDGFTPLFLAANCLSPIAVNIVKAGANVNYLVYDYESILYFALFYETAKLFCLIWERFNPQYLLLTRVPFLLRFLGCCKFTKSDWLECLFMLLQCPIIHKLLKHVELYTVQHLSIEGYRGSSLLIELIHSLYKRKVDTGDRSLLINLFMQLGDSIQVLMRDINFVIELFGAASEFEILIPYPIYFYSDDQYYPLAAFLMVAEESYHPNYIASLFKRQFSDCGTSLEPEHSLKHILQSFGYFSLPFSIKQTLVEAAHSKIEWNSEVCEKLKSVPEFPSLLELSRNQAREFLKGCRKDKTATDFYRTVSLLNVPERAKNQITFKCPVYC